MIPPAHWQIEITTLSSAVKPSAEVGRKSSEQKGKAQSKKGKLRAKRESSEQKGKARNKKLVLLESSVMGQQPCGHFAVTRVRTGTLALHRVAQAGAAEQRRERDREGEHLRC